MSSTIVCYNIFYRAFVVIFSAIYILLQPILESRRSLTAATRVFPCPASLPGAAAAAIFAG